MNNNGSSSKGKAVMFARESKSQNKLVQEMFLVATRHYVDTLREEIRKAIEEKLEQGVYPGRAPFGYQNNRTQRSIEIHPKTAPIIQRIFKLHATGQYSMPKLQRAISKSTGVKLSTKRLRCILQSPFYTGSFVWDGRKYKGTHHVLVQAKTYGKVQRLLAKSQVRTASCAPTARRTAHV